MAPSHIYTISHCTYKCQHRTPSPQNTAHTTFNTHTKTKPQCTYNFSHNQTVLTPVTTAHLHSTTLHLQLSPQCTYTTPRCTYIFHQIAPMPHSTVPKTVTTTHLHHTTLHIQIAPLCTFTTPACTYDFHHMRHYHTRQQLNLSPHTHTAHHTALHTQMYPQHN